MSNYRRGANKERQAIQKLEKTLDNCTYVVRAAGSHSEFDIIASDAIWLYFVQVKSTKTDPKTLLSLITMHIKDIDYMHKCKLPPMALKEMWIYKFRKQPIIVNVLPEEQYRRI